MRKRIFYSGCALAVLTGAYLLTKVTLASVSAQPPSPQPTAEGGTSRDGQEPGYGASIQVPQSQDGDSETDEGSDESPALQAVAKITPVQARDAALAEFPGATVSSVELDNENGSLVYSVRLTDTSGKAWDVKIDAGDGRVLHKETDGPVNSELEDHRREPESNRDD